MTPSRTYLEEQDKATLRATVAFLDTRLTDPATIEWALRLSPDQRIERLAVEGLLNGPGWKALDEPWATAWRLIEESWSVAAIEERPSTAIYGIRGRLGADDHSGAIISRIVGLVAPRLKVEPVDPWRWQFAKKPRRPKTVDQLVSAKLTSGDLADLTVLGLAKLTEVTFLKGLGSALDSAVTHGLEIARRLGWDGQRSSWQLGGLGRVYYVGNAPRERENKDPDAFRHGIAPSVKLLYAVVERLAELEAHAALPFVHRWQMTASPVHVRLWAAAARNPELVASDEVAAFLVNLDNRHFWGLHEFPEIAELRALRFEELDLQARKIISKRCQKGPPRNHWPRNSEASDVQNAQLYWAVRELKRIEVAGGILPSKQRAWVDANVSQFTDLALMSLEQGFPKASEVYAVPPNPDVKYDTLDGAARLRALETALSTKRGGWDDDPAGRADDWLRQREKALHILNDLEGTKDAGDEFPRVWDSFGYAHSPTLQDVHDAWQRDQQAEVDRVVALLNQISESTLSAAIEGVSVWLGVWAKQVAASEKGLSVWLRIWPIAVDATNVRPENANDADLSVADRSIDDDDESMDFYTLNTPPGRLINVFFEAWRSLAGKGLPFATGSVARKMRDVVISATGHSGLIARYRFIQYLPEFLHADRIWTEQKLIAPLLKSDEASIALWRAMTWGRHSKEVLENIGSEMAEKATDRRLGRETRQKLVFSIVIESLYAFRENREPAVPNPSIQQMLRTLDDEVRASAANAVQQFVRDLSTNETVGTEASSPADLFRSAAEPFIKQVWPQERSLATPGVSSAFADLPATSGEAFAEAVDAIEHFLVPFKCWSMLSYGLFGEENGEKMLGVINSEANARALLRLLDLTIGDWEGAVIPHDLTEALDQVRSIAPEFTKDPVYRRLSTAARR